MDRIHKKRHQKAFRAKRTRTKMYAQSHPRLSVFRSIKHMTAQIIDDAKGQTLVSVTEKELTTSEKNTKTERALKLGEQLAKKAKAKGVSKVTFDRASYRYHGRVKAFAEGARKGGLEF
ncbi:50S ribosomal protein L18 [Patescibacteria group bacterium]